MALLTPQQIAVTGLTPTFAAATATTGDTAAPDDRAFFRIKNASGSPINAVLDVPGTVYGQARTDVTVVVGATTGDVLIGPLVADLADPATGFCKVICSAVTSVTIALVRV